MTSKRDDILEPVRELLREMAAGARMFTGDRAELCELFIDDESAQAALAALEPAREGGPRLVVAEEEPVLRGQPLPAPEPPPENVGALANHALTWLREAAECPEGSKWVTYREAAGVPRQEVLIPSAVSAYLTALEPAREGEPGAYADPVCSTCNDTHEVWQESRERYVMCNWCPVPCQQCRAGGNGPFCETTPCSCRCHQPTPEPPTEDVETLRAHAQRIEAIVAFKLERIGMFPQLADEYEADIRALRAALEVLEKGARRGK